MVIWGEGNTWNTDKYSELPPHTTPHCSILHCKVIYGAIQYNAVQYSHRSTQYCKNQHSTVTNQVICCKTHRVSTSTQNYRHILHHIAAYCTALWYTVQYSTMQCSIVTGVHSTVKISIVPWHENGYMGGTHRVPTSTQNYRCILQHKTTYCTAQWYTVQYSTMQCSIMTGVHSTIKNSIVPWHKYGNMGGEHIEYRQVLRTTAAYYSTLQHTVLHSDIRCNTVQCSAV